MQQMDNDHQVHFPETLNMVTYFLDQRLEEGYAEKTALYWAGHPQGEAGQARSQGSWSYAETVAMVNRMGNGLTELGMQPEQRFLTVLFDGPEFVATWFGGIKAGFVATQVNPLLPSKDYLYYLNYTKAPVAIIDASCLERFEEVLPAARYLKHLVVVNGDAQRHIAFQELCRNASDQLEPAPTHRDDPAVWLFTSGSTGKPKAALHTHSHFPYNAECYAKKVVGYDDSFFTISVPKLFFGYATGTNLMFPFAVGASTLLFADRPTPERLYHLIAEYKPNFITTVPTAINKMLKVEPADRQSLKSLKLGVSAGEALPQTLYEEWIQASGCELLDGIGSAESFHIYISNYPGQVRLGSLGKLVPGYQAQVCDQQGNELPRGEVGTLHVKGPSVALMYWSDYQKSIETLRGGTIVSGDMFRQDEEGYYYFAGRTDDLLKVGGIYVSPQEIENCLLQHESVEEACVIGVENAEGLVVTKALVVPAQGVEPNQELVQELQDFAKAKLARYKYPRLIVFLEALPKNDRGKIDRKKLKALSL